MIPTHSVLTTLAVPNKAFRQHTWTNDKKHSWKQWRYGHSSLAVDGNADANLPNCAIMDNYYVDNPAWMVDLGRVADVSGAVVLTWQGAGQGRRRVLPGEGQAWHFILPTLICELQHVAKLLCQGISIL